VLRENISRGELIEMYERASGRNAANMQYYFVFGLFKIAVIAQQIYARYVKGHTRDERFAKFDRFVEGLGRLAEYSITLGRI
jgi:aminoglycoside phosphotransferase (APT) family kinase protein